MAHEGWVPASFDHPKNISVGSSRIIWAEAATCTSGIHHPEGWALPGGVRTRDEEKAKAAAAAIDAITSTQSQQ